MVSRFEYEVSLRVSRARLRTAFDSKDDPRLVCHEFRDITTNTIHLRKERWQRQKFVGDGGFGTVFLEKCVVVTGLEDGPETAAETKKPSNSVC